MFRHVSLAEELKKRTGHFANEIVAVCERLPARLQRLRDQLLSSGTGIASNYRAACRARSHDDFVSKIAVAEEEADETVFWLDVLATANLVAGVKLDWHRAEARELLAVMAASHKTARENQRRRRQAAQQARDERRRRGRKRTGRSGSEMQD